MPRFCGLVLGDMAALQDEFTHGKQEQEDKNGVELGAEESVDHEQFPLSLVWFCGFHDLGGWVQLKSGDSTYSATRLRWPGTSNRRVPIIARVNEHTEPTSV
jgi:hypothetical protein